ncbi:MAG: hypothetical protein E4H01_14810 [Lysobacterales bacterium]|nr:MAG: hypothetical protein E4H01_14810 [Xanthomonadales bacterium]
MSAIDLPITLTNIENGARLGVNINQKEVFATTIYPSDAVTFTIGDPDPPSNAHGIIFLTVVVVVILAVAIRRWRQ